MDNEELTNEEKTRNLEEVNGTLVKNKPSLFDFIDIDKVIGVLQGKKQMMPGYLDGMKNMAKRFLLENLTDVSHKQFIQILLHTNQDVAANILASQISLDLTPLIDLSKYDSLIDYPIDEKDKIKEGPYRTTDSMSNAYSMDSDIRGYCLLINNYFTEGTHNEMRRFRNIFIQLGFKVIMKKNLIARDIHSILLSISKNPELQKHNAFIFMSISHGTANGEIIGFDGKPLRIDLLTELFNNKECKYLQHKPRMFFFNCCRGGDIDEGTTTLAKPSTQWMKPNIPTISDFLICYSTLQGYKAKVDWNEGTCFGKWLSESFIEKAKYKDLDAILKAANEKAEKDFVFKHQIFEWTQSMKRQVYFYAKDWNREENIKK